MTVVMDKNACQLLDADHIAVKHLFVEYARLAALSSDKAAARTKKVLARKICAELSVHAQIEEEIFYPALREAGVESALLDEAEAEHQEAKALIAQIEGLTDANALMDDLVAELAGAIELHVKAERDALFPQAKASLDLDAIGETLRARQRELETETTRAPRPK